MKRATRAVILLLLLTAAPAAAQPEPGPEPAPPPPLPEPITTQPEPASVQPAPAPVELPPRFGARGGVVLTNAFAIGPAYTGYSGSSASALALTFEPSADWFVVENFSIGVEVKLDYSATEAYGADQSLVLDKHTLVGGGPRLGLAVPFGEHVSLWPHVTLGVQSTHVRQSVVEGQSSSVGTPLGLASTTFAGPWVFAHVPLLIHPTPRFFLGIGPSFYHLFARASASPDVGGQATTFGAGVVVGIVLGGERKQELRPSSAPPKQEQFGEAKQLLINGEIGASVGSTSYAGTSSGATSFAVAAGGDYFVAEHVSLGGAASYSWSHSEGLVPASGQGITSDVSGFNISPRLGVLLPMASWIAFYPRPRVSVGWHAQDLKTSSSDNKSWQVTYGVGLYVPVTVTVAEHVVAGFGPDVYQDLGAPSDKNHVEAVGTRISAFALLGGWL